jgi:RES domain-containing protein
MLAWRISKRAHANDRIGQGSALTGGRWNSIGVNVIYLGATLEICVLETLVHTASIVPPDLVIVEFTLPDDSALYWHPDRNQLPPGWDDLPASDSSARFGDKFIKNGSHLEVFLPSVIVPEAMNIVINPNHPGMSLVTLRTVRDFRFDTRLT